MTIPYKIQSIYHVISITKIFTRVFPFEPILMVQLFPICYQWNYVSSKCLEIDHDFFYQTSYP